MDVSVFDMAFYPVPVKVHWDLLFLRPDTAILFCIFFLIPAIISLLVHHPFCGLFHNLFFGRCDILWIGICRRIVGCEGQLLQWRIFLLGVRGVAGRRSGAHDGGGMDIYSCYEI
jgi:hypothetical protein